MIGRILVLGTNILPVATVPEEKMCQGIKVKTISSVLGDNRKNKEWNMTIIKLQSFLYRRRSRPRYSYYGSTCTSVYGRTWEHPSAVNCSNY